MKRVLLILVVIMVASALILSACAGPAPAPAPATPRTLIKIGVIYPLTGPLAMTGERMAIAAKFAFEEAGYEVAGKKVEIIVEDSGAQPNMAVDKAKKLVQYDKVCIVIGPLLGPAKLAVGAYLSRIGVPNLCTHPSPWGITEYEWSFMVSGSEPQHSYPMGLYAYDEMGLRTISVMTEDTIGGHTFLGALADAFTERGGQVVQEQYAPFPCPDFASYLANLKDADAVAAWFHGSDAVRFLTQYHEFGIRERMPLIGAFHGSFFAPFILRELSPEAADAMIGEHCATPYTALLETDASKRFVEAFAKKEGYVPDATESGAYAGAQVALRALETTGGDTTPDKLRQAILSVELEGPEGHIRFDPETRCIIKDIYIFRVDKVEEEYVWVPVYAYEDVPPSGY